MRARGFTLIELVVVISAVALLFGVALDRLLRYQEMGERAALEQNLAAINTALTMRFAAYIAAGKPRAIESVAGKNPVDLLERAPENYLGELFAPEVSTLARTSWYFDRSSGELVYLPGRRRYLSSESGPPEALRFRVVLSQPRDAADEPPSLRQPFILPTAPFRWVIE
jgi:prepilin-type N-terminal cleavage/methylation domain-containing protein